MFKFALKRHKLGQPIMPLFLTPKRAPMTASWFLKYFRQTLAQCNLPPNQFSSHSFRIGAATTAAAQGLSSASLRQLARWSSSAVLRSLSPYISQLQLTALPLTRLLFLLLSSASDPPVSSINHPPRLRF
ncbi:hypothetical protein ATANTOWER_011382 [Ataeniobius toweri]|uniref:Tyr recombinase domain-containing protein n=1 Tax=Ataeniobius toweri TaxID=208326 RepID=A0ABU7A6C3_9TELE|nr:hypothetical protein [Ataeniobius toweri]